MTKTNVSAKVSKRAMFGIILEDIRNSGAHYTYTNAKGEKVDITNNDVIEFFTHEIALLENKSGKKKESEENITIKENITTLLSDGEPRTVTQVIDYLREVTGISYSTPKITAVMRILIAEGVVERLEDKKKAYFRKVGA